ncbi:MAG: UDP-N-acetylmuramoyl-L-alanine--D-glutamate ligase [Bryobacterales bacterium]|nr:UDP-N-acetylmuramoyl-L-alanine--D-glutamate ligase [Bryobacterales bacterium]
MELTGKRALVMGMGKSGLAMLRLVQRQGGAATASDAKPLAELENISAQIVSLSQAFLTQEEALGEVAGFDLVAISPGVPIDLPILEAARAAGIPVVGEVELAAGYLKGPVMAITGTNGKTTTTALAGHLLKSAGVPAQIGGNIGTPVCDLIATSAEDRWNVLELSSFQLETIRDFRADIAVCLNVTPDHLDRHHTMETYVAQKRRLFETQVPGAHAVLNADDPVTASYGGASQATMHFFSRLTNGKCEMELRGDQIVYRRETLIGRKEIPLLGLHNVENVMAASLAALLAGAEPKAVAQGVSSFPGVEHRLEFVRRLNGVLWYNDSKATNVDAALKAIEAFSQPLWIILGGKDKNSDYRPLAAALRGKVRNALLIGKAAGLIASQISPAVPTVPCDTISGAVDYAFHHARMGEVVLLAPACASFDQFQSYEHRGRVFKSLVDALSEEDNG